MIKTEQPAPFYKLTIKESSIPGAGKGLFTEEDIPKGALIVEYWGDTLSMKEIRERYGENIQDAPYIYFISYKKCIDAMYNLEAWARYANDAEGFVVIEGMKNNAIFTNKRGVPYIESTKKIKAGSEILVSYGGDYWKIKKQQMAEQAGLNTKKSKPLNPQKKKSLAPKKKKKKKSTETV